MHSAKGLEFDTVFLPGWEEGLFPSQRTLDDQGRVGLEEERRLAHVGITRARRRAKIYFAANRRMHGLWSSNIPSRFLDELPEGNVEVQEAKGGFASGMSAYGNAGGSRFDEMTHFGSGYSTPGWQRAQAPRRIWRPQFRGRRRVAGLRGLRQHGHGRALIARLKRRPWPSNGRVPSPLAGEGQGGGCPAQAAAPSAATPRAAAARSPSKASSSPNPPAPSPPSRSATACSTRNSATATSSNIDGNKLTIQFDKAGEKRVVDSFVERV